jgi:hypothetical protein
MNKKTEDLFRPLSDPEEIGGYLFTTVEDYANGKLPLDYLLQRFLRIAEQVGGADKAIALLEADKGFSQPDFSPPKDWEDIKQSLRNSGTSIGKDTATTRVV